MAGYLVDVKATNLTGSGAIFAGPARILGIYFVADTTAGSIIILMVAQVELFLQHFKLHLELIPLVMNGLRKSIFQGMVFIVEQAHTQHYQE